jgi:hypothetical protein
MPPEAVVQHRAGVVGEADDPALTLCRGLADGDLDQLGGPILVTLEGGLHHGGVRHWRIAGRLRDQPVFVNQCGSLGQLTGEQVVVGEEVQRELQLDECTCLAGEFDLAGSEHLAGVEVPDLGGDHATGPVVDEPEQAPDILGSQIQAANDLQRVGQGRRGGRISLGEPHRERVQHNVDGAGRMASRGCRAGRLGRRGHAIRHPGPAGPDGGRKRLQMRLARNLGPERSEAPGRVEEQPSGVATAALVEGDLSAQVFHLGTAQGVGRSGVDGKQQALRGLQRAGVALRPGRCEFTLSASGGFGRQHRRPLEERGRRDEPSARLCPAGRAFQLGRDLLVRSGRGLCPVPGAAIGVNVGIGGLGEGAVHVLPLTDRGGPVGHRAHQRMSEPDPRTEVDQVRRCGRGGSVGAEPEPTGGAPEQGGIAERFGRGRQEQEAGVGGQRPEPSKEALFDPTGQRHGFG